MNGQIIFAIVFGSTLLISLLILGCACLLERWALKPPQRPPPIWSTQYIEAGDSREESELDVEATNLNGGLNDNDVDAPPPYTAQVELVLPPPVVARIGISSARIWVKNALPNGALPLAVVSNRTTDSEPVTPEVQAP